MSTNPSISQTQLSGTIAHLLSASIEDQAQVSALDLAYQDAVKRNDADKIDTILHSCFAMILGDGRQVSRQEILDLARNRVIEFEIQDEEPGTQCVRVWGNTAIVTACLHIKGRKGIQEFERRVWFSDT